jgi:agmatine deiminase
MKLLDEETLLVSRYPTGIADGPQIISNINYVLNNHLSTFGTPYKIKWIDAPPSTSGSYPDTGGLYRTFTNSVFINKSVIVPVYRPQVDAAAISLYQQLLPGYNIVGIDVDNSNENLIASLGAIHCITHTIGVQNPLLIVHQPIAQANVGDNVMINATVKHQSGIAEAKLFWRVFGENTFNESVMNNTTNANYTTSIAVPANASKIEYYIEGEANSGKKQTRPLVAPQGFWTMEVQNLSQQDFVNNQFVGPFPNPIVNKASFKTSQLDEEVALTITNALGQKLSSTSFTLDADTFSLELAPEWQGVLYFIFEGSFGRVVKTGVKM